MNDPSEQNPETEAPEGTPAGEASPPDTSGSPGNAPAHGRNDLFPELPLLWLAINLIDAAPRRVRRAFKKQDDAVIRAIERFGFRIPILVRKKSEELYEVIDGHTRLAAAARLGADKVHCIVINDLPEAEVRRLALSLNRLQEGGEWDDANLKLEIKELVEVTGDLEFPGFEMPEIEALCFGSHDGQTPDPADDLSGAITQGLPISRSGDLWSLGDHHVFCGSARDGNLIREVVCQNTVDAVFTDPPYNVKISGNARSTTAGFQEFAEGSGEMTQPEFVAFLGETLGNASLPLKPGGVLFVCMDWRHIAELLEVVQALGLDLLNICIWVKTNPGMGSLYRSQHELVVVVRKPGASHVNNIQLGKHGRNRSNVWHYAGATGGQTDPDDDHKLHPTVKPIRLVMDALLDVTAPGHLILDPFLGSGTTLLAAERTRRRCLGIEIEPAYVDVAIRRWQEMTGGQAVHAETGVTFDALADDANRAGMPNTYSIEEDF